MKVILIILLALPLLTFSQQGAIIVEDSTVVPVDGNRFIRFTTPRVYTQWNNLDSLRGRSTSSKGATLVSPYDLPINTATQAALDLKQNLLGFTPYNATNPNGYITGISSGDVTTALGFAPANASNPTFTAPIGYATGAGGTVAQTGNKSNAVTLNQPSGQITMTNNALAAAAEVSFTLNNSFIGANDVVVVNIKSVGTAGAYFVTVGSVSAGSCTITVGNVSTGSLSQALVLSFAIIKGVIN